MPRTPPSQKPSTTARASGPWGQERRLEFIDFRLRWDGKLNRSDLMGHFGISVPQASADIASYLELAPKNLEYDRSERVYVATSAFTPFFPSSGAEHYLRDLLAKASGALSAETSYLGWLPPVAVAGMPTRTVSEHVLEAFIQAIRSGHSLGVLYQSMSRPEPAWRDISPHGVGHDGFRWHARAYCHTRQAFRDFVLARVLDVRPSDRPAVEPARDEAWTRTVQLVLVPSAGLSASKRKVVELDYAMVDGQAVLETREAMLYYALQRLGLSRDGELRPEAQQISLKNKAEVHAVIERLSKSYD
jgi:hypothetical protein